MSSWKKICCAVDFSDASRAAADAAADLAVAFGAELVLLHVYVIPVYASEVSVYPSQEELRVALDACDVELAKWQESARARGVAQVRGASRLSGEGAAEAILRFLQEDGADVAVLGTHGRTGLKHLLIGSVAERVVRRAACPVLTVRAPEARELNS